MGVRPRRRLRSDRFEPRPEIYWFLMGHPHCQSREDCRLFLFNVGANIDGHLVYPGIPALIVEPVGIKIGGQATSSPMLADQLLISGVSVREPLSDHRIELLTFDCVLHGQVLDKRLKKPVVVISLAFDLVQESADATMVFCEHGDGIGPAGLLEPNRVTALAAGQVTQVVSHHRRNRARE
jgi:hypothetical protein